MADAPYFREKAQERATDDANALHCIDSLHALLPTDFTYVVSALAAVLLYVTAHRTDVLANRPCDLSERVLRSQQPCDAGPVVRTDMGV